MIYLRIIVQIFLFSIVCFQSTRSIYQNNDHLNESKQRSLELYNQAVKLYLANEDVYYDNVVQLLRQSLTYDSNNYQSNQLIGAILLHKNENSEAIYYLELAWELGNYYTAADISNLLEAYRRVKDFDKGRRIGTLAFDHFPNSTEYLKNYGLLLQDSRSYDEAVAVYRHLLQLDSNDKSVWEILIRLYADHVNILEAEKLSKRAIKLFPNDYRTLFQYGAVQHIQQRIDIALDVYQQVYAQNPTFIPALSNIGAIYQSLGRTEEALNWYLKAYELQPNDSGILNNLGSLHGIMGMKEKELEFLLASIALDPELEPVLVNLGGHYQDEGLNDQSRSYMYRAFKLAASAATKAQFAFRVGSMLSPIAMSWEQMIYERLDVERNLLYIVHHQSSLSKDLAEKLKVGIESASDRIHFYLVYHGYNDRYMQEIFAKAYQTLIKDVDMISPVLTQSSSSSSSSDTRLPAVTNQPFPKIRIAFVSKFFGVFEPHGQLLDGIMKYLPRDIFTVICFPVVRTDGKPLGANILEAVDEIYEIPLLQKQAIEFISKLDIDILVFADVLSEPINHYLAFCRLARIQIAFWGNPVTSASRHMDYFISGYHLEHPFRTRMAAVDDPYTEQVVLLSGQGIWYNKPQSPETDILRANLSLTNRKLNATRAEFGFDEDWFIFICPQSTFKIHPLFDQVFAEILYRAWPRGHLVVTGGRRPSWTTMYANRIRSALASFPKQYKYPNEDAIALESRFHVLERVSSERFIAIVQLADVVLHPFLFDGSRTSADALIAGIPYVTLPTEYLRGRMGASFYRTMNLPELVATNKSHYVQIAVDLSQNKAFYSDMKEKIVDRRYLIWEDMQEPFEWSDFLIRVAANHIERAQSLPALSWEDFIVGSGRNLEIESNLRNLREENRRLYQQRKGYEYHLLSSSGEALMISFPMLNKSNHDQSYSIPRVFNDWEDDSIPVPSYVSHDNRFLQESQWWIEAQMHLNTFMNDDVSAVSMMEEAVLILQTDLQSKSMTSDGDMELKPDDTKDSAMQILSLQDIAKHLKNFRNLIREGDLHRSKAVASAHLLEPMILLLESSGPDTSSENATVFDDAVVFTIEYGLLQFYLGEYLEAINYCRTARDILFNKKIVNSSLTAEMCIAIGSIHTMDRANGLSALNHVWNYYSTSPDMYMSRGKYDSSIYIVDQSSLEYNLVSGFKAFQQYERCAEVIEAVVDLSFYSTFAKAERLALVMYAFVNWSASSQSAVENAFSLLIERSVLASTFLDSLSVPLMDIIRMVQQRVFHILDSSLDCLLNGVDSATISELASSLFAAVASKDLDNHSLLPTKTQQGVVLITQFFESPNPSIQSDILEVLDRNLRNPCIESIYLLNERIYDFQNVPNPSHLRQKDIGMRLTFAEAFRSANERYPNRTVIIANADIYFDDSLAKLTDPEHIYDYLDHRVFALLKWRDHSESQSLQLRTDSQDAWIFRTPIDERVIELAKGLVLGSVRCDNRLAMIFTEAGYEVINPAFAIHAIELESRDRVGGLYSMKDAAMGSGKHLLISDLMHFS